MYWGDGQAKDPWNKLMYALRHPDHQKSRLCIEAHFPNRDRAEPPPDRAADWPYGVPITTPSILDRHGQLEELRSTNGVLKVFETTRVREPLDYYLSYYKWTVVGAALSGQPGFETFTSFLEWKPRNLQSNLLLFPERSSLYEMGHCSGGDTHYDYNQPGKDELCGAFGQTEMDELVTMLNGMDVVGTTDRLNEFVVAVQRATGIHAHFRAEEPEERGVPQDKYPVKTEQVCPDMEACRAHVQRLAPYDHTIYERFSATFNYFLETLDKNSVAADVSKLDTSAVNDGWYGGDPASSPVTCAWSIDRTAAPQTTDLAYPCGVVSSFVGEIVKSDGWPGEENTTAFVPIASAVDALPPYAAKVH